MELHFTDIRSFKECRRKFKYANIMRLTAKEQKDSISIGRYGHQLLAEHYGKTDCEQEEVSHEIKVFTESLIDMYKNEVDDSKYTVKMVEQPITVKNFIAGIDLTFTMDLLVERAGKLYLMDHKFYEKTPNAEVLEIDEQLKGYLYLARLAGYDVYGAILNCIVKKEFVKPEPLKSGIISKAQTTLNSTTYELYLEAINDAGLDIADYKAELNMLLERGAGIFHRFPPVLKSNKELGRFGAQLKAVCQEIKANYVKGEDNTHFYPCPTFTCSGCFFFNLCKVEDSSNKNDFQTLINMDYRVKEENER